MLIAVIRLKGKVNLRKDVEETLRMLRLNKRNHCIVLPPIKSIVGMIEHIQPYITYGEINDKTLAYLLLKRGRLAGNKRLTAEYIKQKIGKTAEQFAKDIIESKSHIKDLPGMKPVFRLKPPAKGLEEKGIKKPYSLGGACGYRGKNINELLMRMI
jgi:large subunit ribosomal protein L30